MSEQKKRPNLGFGERRDGRQMDQDTFQMDESVINNGM
jgi:hypothetical protein